MDEEDIRNIRNVMELEQLFDAVDDLLWQVRQGGQAQAGGDALPNLHDIEEASEEGIEEASEEGIEGVGGFEGDFIPAVTNTFFKEDFLRLKMTSNLLTISIDGSSMSFGVSVFGGVQCLGLNPRLKSGLMLQFSTFASNSHNIPKGFGRSQSLELSFGTTALRLDRHSVTRQSDLSLLSLKGSLSIARNAAKNAVNGFYRFATLPVKRIKTVFLNPELLKGNKGNSFNEYYIDYRFSVVSSPETILPPIRWVGTHLPLPYAREAFSRLGKTRVGLMWFIDNSGTGKRGVGILFDPNLKISQRINLINGRNDFVILSRNSTSTSLLHSLVTKKDDLPLKTQCIQESDNHVPDIGVHHDNSDGILNKRSGISSNLGAEDQFRHGFLAAQSKQKDIQLQIMQPKPPPYRPNLSLFGGVALWTLWSVCGGLLVTSLLVKGHKSQLKKRR